MTKEQQIEEMAKIQCDSCKRYTGEADTCNSNECLYLRKKYAETLYNAGYRKVIEREDGMMVELLNKEIDDLKKRFSDSGQRNKKLSLKNAALKREIEVLKGALTWYMNMYGCTPEKNVYDGYVEYSCNGYIIDKEDAKYILKAQTMLD